MTRRIALKRFSGLVILLGNTHTILFQTSPLGLRVGILSFMKWILLAMSVSSIGFFCFYLSDFDLWLFILQATVLLWLFSHRIFYLVIFYSLLLWLWIAFELQSALWVIWCTFIFSCLFLVALYWRLRQMDWFKGLFSTGKTLDT